MKANARFNGYVTTLTIGALLLGSAALAQDVKQSARDVLARNKEALIAVSAVVKLDMSGSGLPIRLGGMGESQESSCGGLVVDPSGLTVVSYTSLNPMEAVAGAVQIQIQGHENAEALKPKVEMSRVRMRLADGTEVPARVVLKDKEQDVAFVMPEPAADGKPRQLRCVKLASGATARELDDAIVVSRQGKQFGYAPTVTLTQISSVITKPRPMFDLAGQATPGSPVFLADGRLLGICAVSREEGKGLASMQSMNLLVLPTAEVARLADEAKKAAEKAPTEQANPGSKQ